MSFSANRQDGSCLATGSQWSTYLMRFEQLYRSKWKYRYDELNCTKASGSGRAAVTECTGSGRWCADVSAVACISCFQVSEISMSWYICCNFTARGSLNASQLTTRRCQAWGKGQPGSCLDASLKCVNLALQTREVSSVYAPVAFTARYVVFNWTLGTTNSASCCSCDSCSGTRDPDAQASFKPVLSTT
jgi:hypothetical protein